MPYKGDKKCSSPTQRLPSRSWGPIRPRVCSWFRAPIRHECQTAQPKGRGSILQIQPPDFYTKKSLRSILANLQNLEVVVHEFELQSRNYVHILLNTLGEVIKPLSLTAIVLKTPLLKVEMSLNKETEPELDLFVEYIYFCLRPYWIWHKVFFFIIGFFGEGAGRARAKTHALLDYVGHRLTG